MEIKRRKKGNEFLPVYIPCYFGDSREKQVYREEVFEKQIDWLLAQDSRIGIWVFLQDREYDPYFGEDEERERITYVDVKHQSNCQMLLMVRNLILREYFYPSAYEWCAIVDNDAILYDHQMGGKIFSHMIDNPKEWKQLDFWHPLDPAREPFNYKFEARPEVFKKNLVFRQCGVMIKGSIFCMANLRLRYNKRIYNVIKKGVGDIYPGEIQFIMELLKAGMKGYKCESSILKEMAMQPKYTTMEGAESMDNRKKYLMMIKKDLAEQYNGVFVGKNKKGNLIFNTRQFYKDYCNYSKELMVRR